jgi:hypothetical protein
VTLIVFVYLLGVVTLTYLPMVKGGAVIAPISAASIFLIVVWLLLVRDPLVATDAYNYSQMFEGFDGLASAYHGNHFFSVIQLSFKQIGLSGPQFVTSVTILIWSMLVVGLFLITRGDWRWFLLSLGLFAVTSTFIFLIMNVLRQGLALSCGLIAIGFFIRNRAIAALIFLLFCIFSHSSGVFFAAIILITRLELLQKILVSVKGLLTVYGLALFVSMLVPLLISSLGDYFGTDRGIGDVVHSPFTFKLIDAPLGASDSFLAKIVFKLQHLQHHAADNQLAVVKLVVLVALSVLFNFLLLRLPPIRHQDANAYLVSILILMTATSISLIQMSEVSGRLLYYASAISPLLLATFFLKELGGYRDAIKAFAYISLTLSFGLFVLLYPSTSRQLGA